MALLTALAVDHPESVTQSNPEVPPPLAELIQRLLAKTPADRPASATTVGEALAALASGGPVPTASCRPNRRLIGGSFGALLVIALLGALLSRSHSTESNPTLALPTQPALTSAESREKSVARLPPAPQVDEVARKLRELTPGYQGTLNPTIDGDGVIGPASREPPLPDRLPGATNPKRKRGQA
jgi:hypothetical protein